MKENTALDILIEEALKMGYSDEIAEKTSIPFIFYGDEGSQNLFRKADEEILSLLTEFASFSETKKEESNIHLLAKLAQIGVIRFNYLRQYIVTLEEVGNWITLHHECARALFALTLFNE